MSRRQLEALLAESGEGLDAVDRAHLHEELGSLLTLVDDAPPAPSPELAALLGLPAPSGARSSEVVPAVVALHHRGAPGHGSRRRLTGPRGAVTGAVVLAVATVGATGLSAAANSLPAPLQRQVADLSRTYLPFAFPEPRTTPDRPASGARPAPEPAAVPGDAPDSAARQDARVPTPGPTGTLVGPRSTAVTDAPVASGPGEATGPAPASTRPSPAPRPASTTRTQGDADVAADAPRATSARPTRPAQDDADDPPAAGTSDAPTGPRSGRPDEPPPSFAMAPPRPTPGPSPSHERPPGPAPAGSGSEPGSEAGSEADGHTGPAKGDQVPDDRGGRADAPAQEPRPRGVVDRAVGRVVDRTPGDVAGALGLD